jgi:perosamine synthetase
MTRQPARIPLTEPMIGVNEGYYLDRCIKEGGLARGRFIRDFEMLFAEIHGCDDAVSTSSGTAALHLAMIEVGLKPGDEVLVPALTFVATANAVRYTGATPVVVDVDPITYTMDPKCAADLITERTRALLVVHLHGHSADMDPICELARRHKLTIVEDAAQALGSRYRGRRCGTIGDIGCFSFNGNKIVTAGGGGMLLAKRSESLEHMRHLSFQSRCSGSKEYLHDELGFNYSLSNLHAAIGLAQLEQLENLVALRRALAYRYANAIESNAGLSFGTEASWAYNNFWLISVLVDATKHGRSREQLLEAFDSSFIDSRPFFTPLSDLGAHRCEADIPVARRLHAEGLILPSSSNLTEVDQDRVLAELLRGAEQPCGV